MARTPMRLQVQVYNVDCHEEADGPGDAEPYLWPVFFKIDGDSFAITAAGLIGFPVIGVTNGEHGNLGDEDVDEGDRVLVPTAVGAWVTDLKPIPIYDPSYRTAYGDDLPGIAGLVVVLMEEDGWPDDIATTGYAALADAVHLAAAKVAASFQHDSAPPTPEEIDVQIEKVKREAAKAVRAAVQEYMTGAQVAWYGTFGNNDDKIGSEAWTVTQDDLMGDIRVIEFHRRWDDDESDGAGDWEINGGFINLDGPPSPAMTCEQYKDAIESLQDELQGEDDANERKRILHSIAQLRERAKRAGCRID